MPRPNKLGVPTRTFNCLLTQAQYDRLSWLAVKMSREKSEVISISDLLREAVDKFLLQQEPK